MSLSRRIAARAPSNIALIKYMGKKDSPGNFPENGSVSMTLDALCTVAELEITDGPRGFRFEPELPLAASGVEGELRAASLSESGKRKVFQHLERTQSACREILPAFGLALNGRALASEWTLRSANTFPQGSGIASSASAFAAITLAAAGACAADRAGFEKAFSGDARFKEALARVSRQGSGSSCRSFDGPFVKWEGEAVSTISSDLPRMAHFVLVISEQEKAVSSSEAHLRVKGSPLWEGRVRRVAARIEALEMALAQGDLQTVSRIAWQESWEMHSLFHTASDPFTYWQPGSIAALQALAPALIPTARRARPAPIVTPIVTMDAGPNVHVIVPEAYSVEWEELLSSILAQTGGKLLRDRQGTGARLLPQGSEGNGA